MLALPPGLPSPTARRAGGTTPDPDLALDYDELEISQQLLGIADQIPDTR